MDTTPQGVSQPAPAPDITANTDQNWDAAADVLLGDKPVEPAKPEQPEAAQEPAEQQPAEANAEAPEETKTETKPDEAPEISSLEELAKANEWSVDDLLGLQTKVKVDGVEQTKSLRDVIKSYQLDQHNTQKSQELSAKLQAAEDAQKQWQEQQQQQIAQYNAAGQYYQQLLNQEYQGVNWDQLQNDDPVRALQLRQNFADRQAGLNAYLSQVNQLSQQQQAQAQERQQAQVVETMRKASQMNPSWSDPSAMQKDLAAIRNAFMERGFQQAQLEGLLAHPAYLVAADAARKYWELQKAKPEVQKKVTAAPKFVKPGASRGSQPKSKAKQAIERALANPKDSDAMNAAFEAALGE